MKTFEMWMATGPLAGEFLSPCERNLMKIAYLEGASAAMTESAQAVERIAGAAAEALARARPV